MRLILMRHAQAVATGEDGVEADFDRHLTPVGRRQAAAVATHLAGLAVAFDAILSSPFKRALETAGFLLPLLATPGGITVANELASESGQIEEMAAAVAATGADTALAVGHMPDIARLCRWLAGGGGGSFDTAQAVCLRFDAGVGAGRGRVEWTFVPSI